MKIELARFSGDFSLSAKFKEYKNVRGGHTLVKLVDFTVSMQLILVATDEGCRRDLSLRGLRLL